MGQNILQNHDFSLLDKRGLGISCPPWRFAFDTAQSEFVAVWYSPSDTIDIPANYLNNGWLIHECQLPWLINNQEAKPNNYPFPKPVNGIGFGQLTLKSGLTQRGFIAQKLLDTLEAGTAYCAEFYTRPFMWTIGLTNNIGIYFTTSPFDYYSYAQNLTPVLEAAQIITDTSQWERIKGSFIATGNELFINFGNFRSDASTSIIPSGFPIDPSFIHNITTYLIDAPLLCKCSDTLYTATLHNDTMLCPNQQLVLQPLLDGFKLEDTTTTYLWSTGSTDSTITVTQPGTYWVQTTINSRFVAGDTMVVDYFPANYQLNLPDTVTFCEGTEAVIQAAVLPAQYALLTAYVWNTGSTLTGIQVRNPGLYWLNAQTPCYTLADSTWVLQDFCESYLWVPNAFTPDGDGTNDFFEFQGAAAPVVLHIFDRWGNRVFYSANYQNNWDGTYQGEPLPSGVYTYLIEFKYINPNATQPDAKGSERQARGTVTIIR